MHLVLSEIIQMIGQREYIDSSEFREIKWNKILVMNARAIPWRSFSGVCSNRLNGEWTMSRHLLTMTMANAEKMKAFASSAATICRHEFMIHGSTSSSIRLEMWYNNLLTLEISFLCATRRLREEWRLCVGNSLYTTSLCLCLVVVIIKILWIQSGWLSVCLRLCVCALLFIIALHAIPSIWWPVTIQLWFDYENWCQNIIYPNGNWERGREGEQNFSVFVTNESTEKSTQW